MLIDVLPSRSKNIRVVLQKPNSLVACVAEDAADLARHVIMVDAPADTGRFSSLADRAPVALASEDLQERLMCQAIPIESLTQTLVMHCAQIRRACPLVPTVRRLAQTLTDLVLTNRRRQVQPETLPLVVGVTQAASLVLLLATFDGADTISHGYRPLPRVVARGRRKRLLRPRQYYAARTVTRSSGI